MTHLSKQFKVIRLANGKFVQKFQYSQGYKDIIECDYPWEAENYAGDNKLSMGLVLLFEPDSTVIEGVVIFNEFA